MVSESEFNVACLREYGLYTFGYIYIILDARTVQHMHYIEVLCSSTSM